MIHAFKHSIWTWLGILGGALTLLSNLQGILDLAEWADWIISKWQKLIMPAVSSLIKFVAIRVSNDAASMIVMAIFVSFIAIGARTENEFKGKNREIRAIKWSNIFNINIYWDDVIYISQIILIKLIFLFPYFMQMYIKFHIVLLYLHIFYMYYLLLLACGDGHSGRL